MEPVRTFAAELAALIGQLDPDAGWYAVFGAHDPQGLRDCLSAREVPPWDVVASLIEDFGHLHGPGAATWAQERLRRLHSAATAAYDVRAGGDPALRSRLALVEGELAEAAARVRALEPDGGAELAWARDHLARAEARRAELRARHAALDDALDDPAGDDPAGEERGEPAHVPGHSEPAAPPDAPARPNRRLRTGGSRFAGAPAEDEADASGPVAIVPPGAPSPDLAPRTAEDAGAAATGEPAPRGARFAGAVRRRAAADVPAPGDVAEARAVAEESAERLLRLRREGSGGEAHALLSDAASREPLRFAALVEELHRRGMASDAGILLWEAAALPVDAFAAAADALSSLGRAGDSARMLRQGVHRPPQQIAEAALALDRAGRQAEAAELLAAVIRARTPAEAAQVALAAPAVLVGLVLDAARALSEEQCRRVADALRTAGVPGVPGAP
ncbi:hypothetical protein G4Z16_04955 [Streptomyces bathyalis]|uniref:UL36 very large tegument protein n=1 Tax=Streptomyces bathyalis TaxID=2710756 RepID=A0A7T1TCF6_9ACTN|nr:hypothetical protein G4Z16_04955 [Streptomyces bathyalis]